MYSLYSFVQRYKECRYPENAESLTITNDSFFDLDVAFYFLHDHNGSTFLLDPSEMSLQRGETKVIIKHYTTLRLLLLAGTTFCVLGVRCI